MTDAPLTIDTGVPLPVVGGVGVGVFGVEYEDDPQPEQMKSSAAASAIRIKDITDKAS